MVTVTMANKASALHILVDDEKQANDILAQLNNGANFQELAKSSLTARQNATVAIWVSSIKGIWSLHSIKRYLAANCCNLMARSKLSLDITSLKCCTAANPEIRHAIKVAYFMFILVILQTPCALAAINNSNHLLINCKMIC